MQVLKKRCDGADAFLAEYLAHDGKLFGFRKPLDRFEDTDDRSWSVLLHLPGELDHIDAELGKGFPLAFGGGAAGCQGEKHILDTRGCHFRSDLHGVQRCGQRRHGLGGHAGDLSKRTDAPHNVGNAFFRRGRGVGVLVHQIQHGAGIFKREAESRPVAADGIRGFVIAHAEGHRHLCSHGGEFAQVTDGGHALLTAGREQRSNLVMSQRKLTPQTLYGGLHLIINRSESAGFIAHTVNGFRRVGHGRLKRNGGAHGSRHSHDAGHIAHDILAQHGALVLFPLHGGQKLFFAVQRFQCGGGFSMLRFPFSNGSAVFESFLPGLHIVCRYALQLGMKLCIGSPGRPILIHQGRTLVLQRDGFIQNGHLLSGFAHLCLCLFDFIGDCGKCRID